MPHMYLPFTIAVGIGSGGERWKLVAFRYRRREEPSG